MFKKDRKDFENKWDDINVFIQYGILTDDKFNEKAKPLVYLKTLKMNILRLKNIKKKLKQLKQIKMISW